MNDRKLRVIETAKVLFANKGFNETSIQDIIDECNISKGTFYNYFNSKSGFLIAYLTVSHKEETNRRNALLKKKDITNKDIFTKQILIQLDINKEFTLGQIFESFYSENSTLKTFMEQHLLKELTWIAERLIDIYGKESMPHAADGAVMVHGIIKNMLYTWKTQTEEEIDFEAFTRYIIRRTDSIMRDLIEQKDIFLNETVSRIIPINNKQYQQKTELLHMFENLKTITNQPAILEHIEFIIEELRAKMPRKHLLQSFSKGLGILLAENDLQLKAKNIIGLLDSYLTESLS